MHLPFRAGHLLGSTKQTRQIADMHILVQPVQGRVLCIAELETKTARAWARATAKHLGAEWVPVSHSWHHVQTRADRPKVVDNTHMAWQLRLFLRNPRAQAQGLGLLQAMYIDRRVLQGPASWADEDPGVQARLAQDHDTYTSLEGVMCSRLATEGVVYADGLFPDEEAVPDLGVSVVYGQVLAPLAPALPFDGSPPLEIVDGPEVMQLAWSPKALVGGAELTGGDPGAVVYTKAWHVMQLGAPVNTDEGSAQTLAVYECSVTGDVVFTNFLTGPVGVGPATTRMKGVAVGPVFPDGLMNEDGVQELWPAASPPFQFRLCDWAVDTAAGRKREGGASAAAVDTVGVYGV